MIRTQCRVWLVLSMLLVAVSARAQVTDCTGQADGTLCTDTDNDVCTIAACDGEECVQAESAAPNGTDCPDTGDDCSKAGCNNGRCDQEFSAGSLPLDSPCPDTDGNVCTIPSCNANHICNQSRSRAPQGTECGENLQCDGVGNCISIISASAAPALSVIGIAWLVAILLALGMWQVRRRSMR